VSGISGVEWDAVELPSQFMENFAWHPRGPGSLAGACGRPARRCRTPCSGRSSPPAISTPACSWCASSSSRLFDFRLHLEFDPSRGARVLETAGRSAARGGGDPAAGLASLPDELRPHLRGRLCGGYYSYLWAEVLSADAYARLRAAGVLDADTGASLPREVLAVGGSRPALDFIHRLPRARAAGGCPAAELRAGGLNRSRILDARDRAVA
jgi:oligopeptidase A